MVRIGFHVYGTSLLHAYETCKHSVSTKEKVVQCFTSNPRSYSTANNCGVRSINFQNNDISIIIHSALISHLLSDSSRFDTKIVPRLMSEFEVLRGISPDVLSGVVLHVGSWRGEDWISVAKRNLVHLIKCCEQNNIRSTLFLEPQVGAGFQKGTTRTDICHTLPSLINEIEREYLHERSKFDIRLCLDTQHCFASGAFEFESKDEIDEFLSTPYLGLVHLNDSSVPFCSHKDRHTSQKIGENGMLWKDLDNLKFFLQKCKFPMIMELSDFSLGEHVIRIANELEAEL